jgi:hypothetical protein
MFHVHTCKENISTIFTFFTFSISPLRNGDKKPVWGEEEESEFSFFQALNKYFVIY